MSLKVKEINLVEVSSWDNASSKWIGLKYDPGSGVADLLKLQAYKSASGELMSSKQLNVNWDSFSDGTNTTCTIFGASLIATSIKSVRLRYKVQVVSDDPDVGDVVSVSEDYAYMMVKMDFGDNSVEDDIPSVVDGGEVAAGLIVEFPSFTTAMVGSALEETLSEFEDKGNWSFEWTTPDGESKEYSAEKASILSSPGVSVVPAHAGFGASVQMNVKLPVNMDGVHTLKISFTYYSGKSYEVPTTISTTAKITINQGTVVATAFSPDSAATIDINFS